MSTRTPVRPAQLVEKTILGFIAGAAAAIGVTEAIILARRIVSLANDTVTTVSGMTIDDIAADGVAAASDVVTSAQYEGLTITVESLPVEARGYLMAAAAVSSLLAIGICVVVAWLCVRVFVGRPFVRSATWGIGAVSMLVILAGLGTPLFTGIAHAEIVEHLGLEDAGLPPFMLNVDLAPLGWGLALAVVAGAFELGQRMQRDSEGLV
jgi:hypothetical protein